MQAKDLTRDYPRSPADSLAGFPWLARLIDKVRAKHAGTLGEYVPYPCGGDKRFLSTFGLDADALENLIASGATDEQIGAWCLEHARRSPGEAAAEFETLFQAPSAPERQEALAEAKAKLAKDRPDLDLSAADSFFKLIFLEEGYPLPKGQPTKA